MKLKILLASILATFCLGLAGCNQPKAEEPQEPAVVDPVEPEPTEPEAEKGTLENPFTVTEAYEIAATLAEDEYIDGQFFIQGVVSGDVNFYKGRLSFDITDGDKTLYVYNMNNEENKASFKEGVAYFAAGDMLTVAGTFKNYKGKLEICYVKDIADCYLVEVAEN